MWPPQDCCCCGEKERKRERDIAHVIHLERVEREETGMTELEGERERERLVSNDEASINLWLVIYSGSIVKQVTRVT